MALNQSVRKEVVKNILTFEKRINHFYLDSVGKVTVGVGHMLPNRAAVSSITMYKVKNKLPGTLATLVEKQIEFDTILKQKKNYKAEWYKKHTTLVMKDADITALLNKHVDSFYKKLKGYPDDFDKLDRNVQAALFDMIFNLGVNQIINKFKKFDAAIKSGDWKKAAAESNRPQLDPKRNTYVKTKLNTAANKVKVTTP